MEQLAGRRALVCGASRGIGRACARALAAAGAEVVVAARDREALEQLCAELPTSGDRRHAALVLDLSDPDAAAGTVSDHLSERGPVHVLVNNTGGPPAGPLSEATADAFLAAFGQHLLANHALAKAVSTGMIEAGYGRIVNIVSTSVKQPLRLLGVSNTVRGAVASWAKTLSSELAPHGITVNCVLPGATATDRLRGIIEARARRSGISEQEVEREMLAEIPAGRFGRPEEIAAVAAFLASPAAGYVNGVNLAVDGGRTTAL